MSDRPTSTGCAEFARTLRLFRRSLIQAGQMGSAGLSLGNVLRAEGLAGQ
jgi:hypothetical protein